MVEYVNSIQIDLDVENWDDICRQVPEHMLHERGIEQHPHCTILYGLHPEVAANSTLKYLPQICEFNLRVGDVDYFRNEKYTVLYFDIHDTLLNLTNLKLCINFPYTTEFHGYHPHLTVAYLNHPEPNVTIKVKPIIKPLQYRFCYGNGKPDEIFIL